MEKNEQTYEVYWSMKCGVGPTSHRGGGLDPASSGRRADSPPSAAMAAPTSFGCANLRAPPAGDAERASSDPPPLADLRVRHPGDQVPGVDIER